MPQCVVCLENVEERGDINVLVMECGHWVCASIDCRPKRNSKWNQGIGMDEEVDLVCPICSTLLEPGNEKMRLARKRVLRFPFCVGRPSEPPNYFGRDKRDPDTDGGSGNPFARAPRLTPSVTSVQSSPSSSPRSSAPSAPSASSSKRDHTSNSTDMRVDKLPNLNAYIDEITKFEIASSRPVLLMVHNAPNSSWRAISPPLVCEAPSAVTDMNWQMPFGYRNGSKEHQAPSHETTSKGKLASSDADITLLKAHLANIRSTCGLPKLDPFSLYVGGIGKRRGK